jgi:hypothetical protein
MAVVSKIHNAPSTFALADLALQAAIELDRMRAGLAHNPAVLAQLADALRLTSEPPANAPPFRFVEPGYYLPFERLYRTQESRQPGALKDIQDYIQRTSDTLSHADHSHQVELTNFCVALHQALIQDNTAEDGVVIHDWRALGDGAATSISPA